MVIEHFANVLFMFIVNVSKKFFFSPFRNILEIFCVCWASMDWLKYHNFVDNLLNKNLEIVHQESVYIFRSVEGLVYMELLFRVMMI